MSKALSKYIRVLFILTLVLSLQINALHAEGLTPEEIQTHDAATAHHEEPGLFAIDPWILLSQTVNFFVLLYVLNRFLFKPVSKIASERQVEIQTIRDNIQQELTSAEELKKRYEEDLLKIEETAYSIRQRAILEANKKSEIIIEEARKKAERIIEEGEIDVFMERQTAWAQIREDVIHLTMLATHQIVEESLDEDLHRRIIANSIKRFADDLPDFKK